MAEYIVTEHPDFPYEEPKPQELIRCRDCVHWKQRFDRAHYCFVFDWVNGENDFCSFAESRQDAQLD